MNYQCTTPGGRIALWSRLRSLSRILFRKREIEEDLENEVRAYVEMAVDEKMAAGMPQQEARRVTLAELGGTRGT